MKAIAFAPGHISAFFEPIYNNSNIYRTGSRGAGINVSLGAISKVTAKESAEQLFEFYINGKKVNSPVVNLAFRHMLGETKIHTIVKTNLELPIGQGFGMSSASALSATYALAEILNCPKTDAMKASHFAEVQLKTGLGDVVASCFGGIEIRKEPGLPPWGIIEHIPGNYDVVLCVIGKELGTKKILLDQSKLSGIMSYGKYCTKKLLEAPSIENLFLLSQTFTEKTKLANKKVLDAIKLVNNFGMASMCMLGNSVFAIGKTNDISTALLQFGNVYICKVDECGASLLKE
ncbi:MAG: pantoate kinase [Candidatus Thermoplasmatota archaeon]|nr:pantoate kinase [Candidatus Thermoplasmatota archaeon]